MVYPWPPSVNIALLSIWEILASEISQWFDKYLVQKLNFNLKGSNVQNDFDLSHLPPGHSRDKRCVAPRGG